MQFCKNYNNGFYQSVAVHFQGAIKILPSLYMKLKQLIKLSATCYLVN